MAISHDGDVEPPGSETEYLSVAAAGGKQQGRRLPSYPACGLPRGTYALLETSNPLLMPF